MQCRVDLRLLLPWLLSAGLGCLTPSSGAGPAPGGSGGSGGANPSSGARPPVAGNPEPGPYGGSGGSAGNAGTGGGPVGGTGGGGANGGGGGGGGPIPDGGGTPIPAAPDAAGVNPDGAAPAPGPTPDAGANIGVPAPAPVPFRSPGIVTYWGQNGISRFIADPARYEKPLGDTCRDNPHYEMMVLGFITEFFSAENVDRTPRTNFSSHCNSMMAYDANHRRLYKCDEIARGINECQRLNKKVVLSLGGAVGSYRFANDEEARTFAQTTWDLFLGGQSNFRPFSTAVVDGIDLDIEGGGAGGYAAYVRRLRELMNADRSRKWYITAAPQCPFPDAFLGPSPGTALGDVPQLFDFLFVQFYNNVCAGSNPGVFMSAYGSWSRVGPKILVGLPARPEAGGGFVARGALPALLGGVKNTPAFGGVMLWDASYDQNSVEGGTTYGAFVKSQLP